MQNKKINRPVYISQTTVSRRSVLDWLGKATVLALGGNLLTACTNTKDPMLVLNAEPTTDPDAGYPYLTDSGAENAQDSQVTTEQFPFSPSERLLPLYDKWGERTVDPQGLTEIIENWQLRVDGLVEQPMTFSFGDLLALNRQDQITDFHCVEGWSVYDVPWNGFHMSALFDLVKPLTEATHITFYSIGDIYLESIPIEISREETTMLAYGIGDTTIPLVHGFPLRLVIPRLLAYKNAKYIYRIELTNQKIDGFWVKAGYPYDGEVPEARLRDGKY